MHSVKPQVSFSALEHEVLSLWDSHNVFHRSIKERAGSPRYMFYDGPPFATGTPHYGHLLAGTIKDIVPRYWTMKGRYIERRFGWDTHGLPIEMLTEKELGLSGRKQILEFGVDKFNEACRSGVLKYVNEWQKTTRRLGRWIDFIDDYKTMDLKFMDSVWWVVKQLWDGGRVYEGVRVVPYSWRLSTPLSNFEAGNNYKDVQDPAVTIRFKLEKDPNISVLAWTTTPWTLPSNLALCVGLDIDYVEVKTPDNERIILAKSRLSAYFPKTDTVEVIREIKGKDLVGLKYQPLFDFYKSQATKECFTVLADDYVTTDDGTGVVHQSPANGEDDYRIGSANGLPIYNPVDEDGNFFGLDAEFNGMNVKEADKVIIKNLKDKGLLFKQDTIQHSYPFCERSDTPLIYRAISAWYVKVEDLREEMVDNNSTIHWIPEHIKDGRFGKWLAAARDWNISRNRFWGNPLPIWRCDQCGELECLGSAAELEEKSGCKVTDLHKHHVDPLSWKCAKCHSDKNGIMRRIPEVLDCWFESGSMPYAQLHYPFENKEAFESSFPADFIAEGLDQTRGWFYTLMVLSTAIFKKAPFKNVIVNGMILAEDGKKMSKSLKNYPDPHAVMEEFGADALRLYMISSAVVRGEALKFSGAGVKEIVRSVMLPYWNVYSFFTTYAVLDNFTPSENLTASANILDRWIISRLQTLLARIESEMNSYRLYAVIPALLNFLEDLTNWYIRRSRRRFWSEDSADKQDGYNTIYYVLTEFSKALAPFLPFVTEQIYQNLKTLQANTKDSIHLCDYPIANTDLQDIELEEDMILIAQVVTLGRALRSKHDIKIRQPLQSITVITVNKRAEDTLKKYAIHIQEELNVKEVLFSSEEEKYVNLQVKPDFKKLGPVFGKEMKECAAFLQNIGQDEIDKIESGHNINVLGKEVTADQLQVIREPKGEQIIETAKGVTVFFDINITENLRSEGLAREVINRIQRMRKDADLDVSDRINVSIAGEQTLLNTITTHQTFIAEETLAKQILSEEEISKVKGELKQEQDIDGYRLTIGISRSL